MPIIKDNIQAVRSLPLFTVHIGATSTRATATIYAAGIGASILRICAIGAHAHVLFGASTTSAATVGAEHGVIVPNGAVVYERCMSTDVISVIGATGAGSAGTLSVCQVVDV